MRYLTILAAVSLLATAAHAQTAGDKNIGLAKPFVEAAFSTPMADLYARADTDAAQEDDAMRFGLGLLAGRAGPSVSASDTAMLDAMEPRVIPLAQAYLDSHPGVKISRDEWARIVKATPDELAMIDRYQRHTMGDFWLKMARDGINHLSQVKLARARPGSSGGTYAAAAERQSIDLPVFVTAVHCVSAVRKAAGLSYQRPEDLPASVQILWDFAPYDVEGDIEWNLKDGKAKNAKGAVIDKAACGTEEAFNSYVAELKTGG